MDNATLVNLDIEQGKSILQVLDESHVKIQVALWLLSSDYEDWRLVLSGSSLSQNSPLNAYETVIKALGNNFGHSGAPILILRQQDPFIKALKELFGKTREVEGLRLGGQTIGNRYVSDAYVYRIRP